MVIENCLRANGLLVQYVVAAKVLRDPASVSFAALLWSEARQWTRRYVSRLVTLCIWLATSQINELSVFVLPRLHHIAHTTVTFVLKEKYLAISFMLLRMYFQISVFG